MTKTDYSQYLLIAFLALILTPAWGEPLSIWFDKPAANWNEALPIGNGRLGGMVFGGVAFEHLQLNDNTLYSGEPGDRDLPLDVTKGLPQVRQWLKEGKYAEAHAWVTSHWLGRAQNCYEPLGDLHLEFPGGDDADKYRRELDLNDGVVRENYEIKGVQFSREIFASHPAQAIVIRLRSSKPGGLSFVVRLDSIHPTSHTAVLPDDNVLSLTGRVPWLAVRRGFSTIEKNGETWKYPELFDSEGKPKPGAKPVMYSYESAGKGTRFDARVKIQSTDGKVIKTDGVLAVQQATEAVLVICSGSSFNGFDSSPSQPGRDESAEAVHNLAALANDSFAQLEGDHIQDYRALFDRVTLSLGSPNDPFLNLPTPDRLKQFAQGGDEALAALYYQFGRYLLISGSRPGGQPLNLQGIWNPYVVPPWAGAYTLNINLEMNYWPAEESNLSECEEPLFHLIGDLAQNGRKVAQEMYGRPGWVAHHNTTIWRDAQPIDGDAGPAFWNMAGPWLCQSLWSHYLFTDDLNFLRTQAYPIMKGAAEFMASWLVEDDQGHLVTPVGTSPENRFAYVDSSGKHRSASLVPGPTMDIALIRELFTHCVQAANILGIDESFRSELQAKVSKLPPYKIGSFGQIQEWPIDFAETEITHRHVSHLYGLYPGDQITVKGSPDLAEAARRTLDRRGDFSTGWSLAWKINLSAHLRDGDRAHKCLAILISPTNSYPNLFDICPPFQIDGNFGGASGIQEMLLQSSPGEVDLLPALPAAWSEGSFAGLKARGGYEVSCRWKNGKLESASLRTPNASEVDVRCHEHVVHLAFKPNQEIRLDAALAIQPVS